MQPCGSGECNIWTKQRLYETSPAESPTRRVVAPPDVPEERYVASWLLAGGGLLLCLFGGWAILLGLAAVAAGGALGVRIRQAADEARAAQEEWKRARWCVSCDRGLDPPPTERA